MRTLSREEARHVYDRIGSFQDSQGFYEDRAIELLIRHGEFSRAKNVYEFGCGTGRLALRLLAEELPPGANYRAVDISPTMVGLAADRLAPLGARAEVILSDGSPPVGEASRSYDRFVSTYVLDLLSAADIDAVLHEAHRILMPGGRLCLTSLSNGSGPLSRAILAVWSGLHRLRPSLVGGCRPLDLLDWLDPSEWRVRFEGHVAPFGVPSEVVIAERI